MNNEIKCACLKKAKIYRRYVKNIHSIINQHDLQNAVTFSTNLISEAKNRYICSLGEKLNDPKLGVKAYWSIVNKFLHKKKIPLIPPIVVNDNIITSVSEKAGMFNNYFAKQCTLRPNASVLPDFLDSITFSVKDIYSIIRSLDSNKAHGYDNVSIRMIKMCDESIALPLKIIFESAMQSGIYPDQWKKASVIPVHKKNSKNELKNYRPISLLPIFGKNI